jgi:hypothetical protein
MFKSSISSGLIIIFGTQYDFNAYFLAFLGRSGTHFYLIYLQL